MKVRVVDPKAVMLTSIGECRRQFVRCAFAAGLSRGRMDVYALALEDGGGWSGTEGGTEQPSEPKGWTDAEALIGRLLAIKPHAHETVIEHSGISFLFRMSRIASHELVRHRLTAITQQSTRYCESGKDGSVTFIRPLDRPEEDCGEYDDGSGTPRWVINAAASVGNYRVELENGRKREYARYLLPHCIEVWLCMTANFREWRHIIRLRTHKAAAPEMRLLIGQVRERLEAVSPVLVEGL